MILRTLIVATGLSLLAGTALAADLTIPAENAPIIDNTFDWEGAYAGAELGLEYFDPDFIYGAAGVFVGYNFLASENVLLGVEGSLGFIDDDAAYGEAFVFGRAGMLVTPDLLAYGIAGVGYEWLIEDPDDYSDIGYQLGAGIEAAVADNVTLRGQLTGYGYFDDSDLFDAARATVGIAFHF